MGGGTVNGRLHLDEGRVQDRVVSIKTNLHFEEGLEDLLGEVAATANTLFHLVERVLGGVEEGLVHGPRVVLGQFLDLLGADGLDVLVESVRADSLDEVLNGLLNLVVLALELLGLGVDPLGLHLDERIESVRVGVSGQVHQDSLRKSLEVVLNTVLHNIVDVDDELLELGETLVDVLEVAIDVHRGPGEDVHTGTQLVLQVFEVGHQEGLSVGANLVDDAMVLTENEGELIVVHLEFLFLEEHNLGALRDLDSDTREALGLADKGHDLRVEVDVESVVAGVTDDEGGEKTCLGLVDLNDPSLSPLVLEVEESVGDLVVGSDLLHSPLGVLHAEKVTGELLHGGGGAVEQMA